VALAFARGPGTHGQLRGESARICAPWWSALDAQPSFGAEQRIWPQSPISLSCRGACVHARSVCFDSHGPCVRTTCASTHGRCVAPTVYRLRRCSGWRWCGSCRECLVENFLSDSEFLSALSDRKLKVAAERLRRGREGGGVYFPKYMKYTTYTNNISTCIRIHRSSGYNPNPHLKKLLTANC